MAFGILGPLLPSHIIRPAQRRLLSILFMYQGVDLERDLIIDRMWGEQPPSSARNALHVHINGLRNGLGRQLITTTANGYRLDLSGRQLDVAEFDRLTAIAGESDPGISYRAATSALALWRGHPYLDLANDDFAKPEIVRLNEQRLELIEARVAALLALGRNEEALPELERLVNEEPLRERLWEHLMLGRYRAGRQADALRAFQQVRSILGEELGIEPGPDLRELEERILFQDPSLGAPAGAPTAHNLPTTPTSFVARDEDLAAIEKLLGEHRCVTVVGGPGFGKTRLATETGWALLSSFPGGVWLASLAGADSAMAVAATIATATGTTEQIATIEQLAALLASRALLLVLDNCEHVVEPVARLGTAMLATPGPARILATSRHHLSIPGEQVLRLAPLAVDDDNAVRLLVDRIRSNDRSFQVTQANREALWDLCRRMEGIPLGLEIVARWIPALGLGDIDRLMETAGNDTALDAALQWSYDLLQPSDRDLLDQSSVFATHFTLDLVHEICAAEPKALATAGTIVRLVDASLLQAQRTADGAVRYRMLEPVRDFVRPRLTSTTRVQHAEWFHTAALMVGREGGGPKQAKIFAAVDSEIAEYRTAMSELRRLGEWDDVAAIATALARYWYSRFLAWEGQRWLDESLDTELSDQGRIGALLAAGFLAWAVHDYPRADGRYREALAVAQATDDPKAQADALFGLGLVHDKRRFEDGADMLDQAAAIYATLDGCDLELGETLLFRGLREASRGGGVELLDAAVELLGSVGHLRQVSKAERWLARAAWLEDDEEPARQHAHRAEQLGRETRDEPALAGALIERALIEVRWGGSSSAAAVLLEALDLIPETDLVDVCQVLWPAAWLAESENERQRGADILRFIDDVYEDAGWLPLDEMAGTPELRARLGTEQPRVDVVHDVVLDVREFLTGLSEKRPIVHD